MSEGERMRARLPDRRLRLVDTITTAAGNDVLAEIGFDEEGVVREIFCEGFKPGSEIGVLAHDICILVSKYLLQGGYSAEELLATLMRTDLRFARDAYRDAETGVARPSLLATLLMRAVERGLVDAEAVREAYACAAVADPWRDPKKRKDEA